MVLFVHLRAPVHFTDVLKGIKIFHIYIKTFTDEEKSTREQKDRYISTGGQNISAPYSPGAGGNKTLGQKSETRDLRFPHSLKYHGTTVFYEPVLKEYFKMFSI